MNKQDNKKTNDNTITLLTLSEEFTVHRFASDKDIPTSVFSQNIYFIGKTNDELSIVVPSLCELSSDSKEENWRALMVKGPLDFSLTGILSGIANVLAEKKISIFAISTFDTDYILVKSEQLNAAQQALASKNYKVTFSS